MRTTAALAALLLVVVVAPAQQQCWETHAGEALNANTTTGGPNMLLGMRVVAPSAITIAALQVLTGLRAGPGSMAVWSHDAANNRPGALLAASGSYAQSPSITWQGAALPSPVVVTAGQVLWLVWGMPNSSRWPASTSAAGTIPYRASFDGGATWNGAFSGTQPWPAAPLKVRVFCDYTTAPVTLVGQGKPGLGGVVPSLQVTGWPANGNELGLLLDAAAPQAPAVIAVGTPQQLTLPVLGTLYVAPLVIVPLQTSAGRNPGDGRAVVPLPLPGPSAIGFPVAVQFWVVDAAAAGGLAHTAGASTVIS